MKGFIFNTIFVLIGGSAGLLLEKKIDERVKNTIFDALGLFTLYIGIKMAFSCKDAIPVVFSIVLGTFLGTLFSIEEKVTNFLDKINANFLKGKTNMEGFIVASTLFCIGSMTIIGSLKDGLYHDATLIKTKSIMDGFASLILSSKYGLSVLYSAASVFLIQGGLTLFSTKLTFLSSVKVMEYIDGTGGIIVVAIGLNLLNLKNIKTLNMLPSLLIVFLYSLLWH